MNLEKFDTIFRSIISLWPSEVKVTDKTLYSNGGADIPNLSRLEDSIETKTAEMHSHNSQEIIDWSDLIHWSIYQLLHHDAKQRSCEVIYPHKLERDRVLKRCLEHEEFSADWISD